MDMSQIEWMMFAFMLIFKLYKHHSFSLKMVQFENYLIHNRSKRFEISSIGLACVLGHCWKVFDRN